jgi:hypothetical protein
MVGEADVKHLRLFGAHGKADSFTLLAESVEAALRCLWVSTHQGDVVGKGESSQSDSGVLGASAPRDDASFVFSKRATKDAVDENDEDEGGERVPLKDAGSRSEGVCLTVSQLHESASVAIQVHHRSDEDRWDAVRGQQRRNDRSADRVEGLAEIHKDNGNRPLSSLAGLNN